MKVNLFIAVLLLTGAVPQLHSAPWAIAWSHLIASDHCEANAVLLKSSSREVIVRGTTLGSQTKLPSDPYVFRSVLDGKGNPVSAEQFGIAGGQRLQGTVRSCWGNETLVSVEFDPTLKEMGRFYVDRNSPIFFDSLEVSSDGRDLTISGTAHSRWLGKPTNGTADAFVVRCHRDELAQKVAKPAK